MQTSLDDSPFRLLRPGESLVVDGANLRGHCKGHEGKPCTNPLPVQVLLQLLKDRDEWQKTATGGAKCIIIVDASLRHHVDDAQAFEKLMRAYEVIQAPAGTPADPFILKEADRMQAVVLSNDKRMRTEHAGQYSWLSDDTRFIQFIQYPDNRNEYARKAHTAPSQVSEPSTRPGTPRKPSPPTQPTGSPLIRCAACNSEVKADPGDPYCPKCHNFLTVPLGAVPQAFSPLGKVGRLYVVTKDDQRVVLEEINGPEIVLGRERLAKYALTEPGTISRVHAKFGKEGDNYYVWDEGSTNGTYLDQQDIRRKGKQLLADGTQVRLVSPDTPTVILEFKTERG
jgi:hypothetical protein